MKQGRTYYKNILTAGFLFIAGLVYSQPTINFPSAPLPVIFAPGFISDGFENRDMTVSPTNDELFFTIQHKAFSVIMYSKKQGNTWSKPEVAPFSGKYKDMEAAFSPDGNKIFFTSDRPLSDTQTTPKDYDIWCVKKKNNAWTVPINAGKIINTVKDEFYPSTAKNGNLYFTRDNGKTKEDIFMAPFQNNRYTEPVPLPEAVNSDGYDFNAFVDPDEAFIIFTSYKRKDDRGGGDLYISRKEKGVWKPAKNLGDAINSTSIDYCPFVSFDKKHFFFTAKKTTISISHTKSLNAEAVKKILSAYGNGTDDIYIVDFTAINDF